MKKLFVLQNAKRNDYSNELFCGLEKCKENSQKIKLNKLSVDFLLNSIDVVISNGLPKEWYFILKGLNIVTITLDKRSKYVDLADIVIDYKSEDSNRYFTGKDCSICNNKDFLFEEIANLLIKLEWDSSFWGFPAGYLSSKYLTDNIFLKIENVIKKENFKLIEYLCNCHDNRSVKIAEKSGFHFVDIRLSFEKKLTINHDAHLPKNVFFGKANESHIRKLRELSKDLYKDSRYFFDEHFDRNKANEFYQGWVEKAVLGQYDDECYCLYIKNIPIGFCTVKYNISDTANIGLFGLDRNFQGKGFGKTLLHLTFNILFGKNIQKVYVVTQGRNYAAQRLYQSAGFLTKTTELWYHKWL